MLFEACNSVYEGPKKGKPGTVISISDRESSSALTIMDSLTIRSELFNGDVYTLSIYQGLNDTVRIFSNQVTPNISDKLYFFTGDGSFDSGNFYVPTGTTKYWKVYFDPSENPQIQSGGAVGAIDCNCTNGGTNESCDYIVANPGTCTEKITCTTGGCNPVGETASVCKDIGGMIPFVIIQAEVIIFDGVIFN
jgi:hypothetical protein